MRWAGYVAHMGEIRNAYKIFVRKSEGRRLLEDLCVYGRIILEWILGDGVGRCGLDSSVSRQGPVASCFEHGDEPSGSIKGVEFLD